MQAQRSNNPVKAAPRRGAACLLCVLLAVGVLWPVPLSFAASEQVAGEPTKSEGASEKAEPKPEAKPMPEASAPEPPDNVVVAPPAVEPADPAPEPSTTPELAPDPKPVPAPEPEPSEPTVPVHDRMWAIGKERPDSVVAELWDDGTFVVDGYGAAGGFDAIEDVPWLAEGWADDIKRVIFADKVQAESLAHWFEGCANLSEIANVPVDSKDMTRAFYACPNLVELPDDFAVADMAAATECFGLEATEGESLLTTVYRGTNEAVLAYAWERDGRKLVDPDAPIPPVVDTPDDSEDPDSSEIPDAPSAAETPETPDTPDASATPATPATPEIPEGENPSNDEPSRDEQEPLEPAKPVEQPAEDPDPVDPSPAPDSEPEPQAVEETQVNITVPSSVSMVLDAEGDSTAIIPVLAANRSERSAAIVGARLKRSSQELPGGSWSLTTESGSTTFVQDARFTPLGLEAAFDRPVVLDPSGDDVNLVWHGSFTDHGMKQLVNAALNAGDGGFTYGSMIWIVAAAE